MKNVVLFGRVLPERVPIRTPEPIVFRDYADWGFGNSILEIFIADSQIIAKIEIDTDNDVYTIRNVVQARVDDIVSYIGFKIGLYLNSEIISAYNLDSGSRVIFGQNVKVLLDKKSLDPQRDQLLPAEFFVFDHYPLCMALQDLREAMNWPVSTAFFCFRAIDALAHANSPPDAEHNYPARKNLSRLLNVEWHVIKRIQKISIDPRHGKPTAISDNQRATSLFDTDEIIKRYIHFLSIGRQQLPESEFPLFVGWQPPDAG